MKPWKRLVLALSALVISGAILAGVAYSPEIGRSLFGESNLVMYWSPSELLAKGDTAKLSTVRLGGMVVRGTEKDWAKKLPLKFFVTDMKETIPVSASGAPPDMFQEGIGVIVEGRMDENGVFQTGRPIVKHSNEYRVPTDGKSMKDMARTLEEAQ